jgi:hypothetical protein
MPRSGLYSCGKAGQRVLPCNNFIFVTRGMIDVLEVSNTVGISPKISHHRKTLLVAEVLMFRLAGWIVKADIEVKLVPKAGFEPAWVAPHAPQTCVSTRFHHFGTGHVCYYKNRRVFKPDVRSAVMFCE